MNIITIYQPRYSTQEILPAAFNVKPGKNLIKIIDKRKDGSLRYPDDYIMESTQIQSYPSEIKKSKEGREYRVYVIPMTDLRLAKKQDDVCATHDAILLKDGRCPIELMKEEHNNEFKEIN